MKSFYLKVYLHIFCLCLQHKHYFNIYFLLQFFLSFHITFLYSFSDLYTFVADFAFFKTVLEGVYW